MSTLAPEHVKVLDELRERSDGTHEEESVTSRDFPGKTLPEMALLGLVRLSGGSRAVHRAWITDRGVAALLSHEVSA